MIVRLKKNVSIPGKEIPLGTVNEFSWFSEQLKINCEALSPEVKNEWFEPHFVDLVEKGLNEFDITLRTKTNLKKEVYDVLYKLTYEEHIKNNDKTSN